MGSDRDTVLLRGEGGVVQEYDLPLRPPFADAVEAGRLVVVDQDGEPVPAEDLDAGGPDTEDGGPPAKSAKVDEWRAYAVSLGADEDEVAATKKDDLIAAYAGGPDTEDG